MELYAEVKNNDRTYISLYYDPAKKLYYNDWVGFVNKDQVIQGCLKGLQLVEQKNYPYMLNDNSNLTGPWAQANEWIATEWMPRAIGADLKYFAHILSPNIFAQLSAQQMEMNANGFHMKSFENIEAGKRWLEEMRQKELVH